MAQPLLVKKLRGVGVLTWIYALVQLIDLRFYNSRWARRRRDATNRRRVLIELTPKGARLLRRLASEHYATIQALGSAFLPPLRHRSRSGARKRP